MASHRSPDWGPQEDPWEIYCNWLAKSEHSEGEGRVQVDGNCFACMHGACPEELCCTPVKARMYAVVKYFYVHYRIPLCTVCSELYDWDPSFTMWVRDTYIEERQKGAA